MNSDRTSTRFPWVAATLSFLSSGVGHIYCGEITKGLFLYSARFFLPLLCVLAAFLQPSTAVLVLLISLPAAATVILFFYAPLDAHGAAKRSGAEYELKEYNRSSLYWLLILMQLAYPVAMTWGIREYAFEAFYIPTRSMSPNLLSGDRMIANKRPLTTSFPERGDLVVFRTPAEESGRTWVKRVIGVAGDQIVIKGQQVQVNGKTLERDRVPNESVESIRDHINGDVYSESNAGHQYRILLGDKSSKQKQVDEISVTVPDRSVFVLGDNRDRSRDSRHIGSIHVGDIIGYVDYIYYPVETWSRFGAYQD